MISNAWLLRLLVRLTRRRVRGRRARRWVFLRELHGLSKTDRGAQDF